MSNLCLGVMDSGMGGLTVVDLLHKKYPEIKTNKFTPNFPPMSKHCTKYNFMENGIIKSKPP